MQATSAKWTSQDSQSGYTETDIMGEVETIIVEGTDKSGAVGTGGGLTDKAFVVACMLSSYYIDVATHVFLLKLLKTSYGLTFQVQHV